jgi:uncharacterized protein YhbP (UPF0306 family)
MSTLPAIVNSFILDNHVLSVATAAQGLPWAASCFYAFDSDSASLLVLTAEDTRHGEAMLKTGLVAGTIAGQPTSITEIRGVQFLANAELLQGHAADEGYRIYCIRHPIARLKRSSTWRLAIQELKYTDNAKVFGKKVHWARNPGS